MTGTEGNNVAPAGIKTKQHVIILGVGPVGAGVAYQLVPKGIEGLLTFSLHGLFGHDNTHHTPALACAAVACLSRNPRALGGISEGV